jgi:DNA/RNA endonuclease YhcR with UshA esterase domain
LKKQLVVLAFSVMALAWAAPIANSAPGSPWCQGSQTWQSVRASLNTLVRVKARIARVNYAAGSPGQPTFIDLGGAYPSPRRVTLVIWGRDRSNFLEAPERMFKRGQIVCAQGVATLYRGVPQLELGLWDSDSRLLTS